MEPIEIYPVEESAGYVRALEERIRRLESRIEQHQQQELLLMERTTTLNGQRTELTRLLKEADDMLKAQIEACRDRERLVAQREAQLEARENYLVAVQFAQEEAIDRVRGLIVEE